MSPILVCLNSFFMPGPHLGVFPSSFSGRVGSTTLTPLWVIAWSNWWSTVPFSQASGEGGTCLACGDWLSFAIRKKQSAHKTIFLLRLRTKWPGKFSDTFHAPFLEFRLPFFLSVRTLDYSGYKTSTFHGWPDPQRPFLLETILLGLAYFSHPFLWKWTSFW